MVYSNNALFALEYKPLTAPFIRMKPKVDGQVFEVHVPKLEDSQHDLFTLCEFCQVILDECTREVQSNPIDGVHDEEVLGKVLNAVFVRALPRVERAIWDTLPNYANIEEWSLENWHERVRDWLMTKYTIQDYHAVAQQLRNWRKPRNVSIFDNQNYMMKINLAIAFMTADVAPLNEAEFKQSFFSCHPDGWKNEFLLHNDVDNATLADISSFMRKKAEMA